MTITFKKGVDVSVEKSVKLAEKFRSRGFQVDNSISAVFVEVTVDDLLEIHEVVEEMDDEEIEEAMEEIN